MRNQTLLSLLRAYRHECHISDNPAHNSSVRDTQVRALQAEQERLWEKHDWPFLRVRRYVDLSAGQRYYDSRGAKLADGTAATDLGIERLEGIEVRWGEEWVPLGTCIEARHYAAYDSDLDQRSWPVERWQIFEEEQFEVHPVPADNTDATTLDGRLRLTGIRDLRPLVADGDRADLDNNLIVKFAAARYLAGKGAKDAQVVLDQAMDTERSLTGNFSKAKKFSLAGRGMEPRQPRGPHRVHYRVNEV